LIASARRAAPRQIDRIELASTWSAAPHRRCDSLYPRPKSAHGSRDSLHSPAGGQSDAPSFDHDAALGMAFS
jgi:hypothetical protein